MKKTMMQLAVTGMVLAWAMAVFAASQTSVLWAYRIDSSHLPNVYGTIHANGRGTVTFSTARRGGWDITVSLLKGAGNYEYIVRSNGFERGRLTTDSKGNGRCTFHVADARVSILGDSINIWADFHHLGDGSGLVDMTDLMWCATNPIL